MTMIRAWIIMGPANYHWGILQSQLFQLTDLPIARTVIVCYLSIAYLASTQATFIASHNRIARRLAEINPHWDDERLFQVNSENPPDSLADLTCMLSSAFTPQLYAAGGHGVYSFINSDTFSVCMNSLRPYILSATAIDFSRNQIHDSLIILPWNVKDFLDPQ